MNEADQLKLENATLRERLTRLSEPACGSWSVCERISWAW